MTQQNALPYPPCEVCDCRDMIAVFQKGNDAYQKCPQCGLIRIYPQPSDDTLAAIYQGNYYQAWGENEDVYRQIKRMTFSRLLRLLPLETPQGKKLLDVGAATGLLMELAAEYGYDVFGVETAADGVAAIARKFGAHKVASGYFNQIDVASLGWNAQFDVVVMCDLFEHVRDPNQTLQFACELLNPNGYILLYLPNTASFSCKILGKTWEYFSTEHLFSFSLPNIRQMLHKHDLDVITSISFPKCLNIDYAIAVTGRLTGGRASQVMPLFAKLPRRMRRIPLLVPVGQMAVVARKV